MPTARLASVTGPIDLHYEDTGSGFPLIWCHEYGGDYRSWEQQVRYFSRRYRVVTWNYRGYPPSEVPKDGDAYSVEISKGISRKKIFPPGTGVRIPVSFGLVGGPTTRILPRSGL